MITEEHIKEALRAVKYPGYSRDVVSFGLVKQIKAQDAAVSILLEMTSGTPEIRDQIKADCERALKALPGLEHVHVEVKLPTGAQAAAAHSPWQQQNRGGKVHYLGEPRVCFATSWTASRSAGL